MNKLFLSILLALPIAASTAPTTPTVAGFFESAQRLEAEGDYDAALIELKNALQRDPAHLPSLVLRAQVYLDTRNAPATEDAARKALEAGADPTLLRPILAEALLMRGRARQLVDEITPRGLGSTEAASVHAFRARAYLLLHDYTDAEVEVRRAKALAPILPIVLEAEAALAIATGKLEDARKLAETLLDVAPTSAEAWNLAGSVAHLGGDLPRAMGLYQRAIELDAESIGARMARIGILLANNRLDAASEEQAALEAIAPDLPSVQYLGAVQRGRMGDEEGAREQLTAMLAGMKLMGDEFVEADENLVLAAGLAHHALGNLERARLYFDNYLSFRPEAAGIRKLLGKVLLALNLPLEALSAFEKAGEAAPRDIEARLLEAEALTRMGRHREALRILEKAKTEGLESAQLTAQQGLIEFGRGEREAGLDALAKAFQAGVTDDTESNYGATLAAAYLLEGKLGDAQTVVDSLLAFQPENPLYLNLAGSIAFRQNRPEDAAAFYNKALSIEPDFVPAQINLGKQALALGDIDSARRTFEALLERYPEHPRLLQELALTEVAAGNNARALTLAEDARRIAPTMVPAHLLTVRLRLATGSLETAIDAAQAANLKNPANLEITRTLAELAVKANDIPEARRLARRCTDLASFDEGELRKIASFQMSIGEPDDAERTLFKAQQAAPDSVAVQRLLVELELRRKDFPKAREAVERLRELDNSPLSALLYEGDLAVLERDYDAASAAYSQAYALQPTHSVVMRLFDSLASGGKLAEAAKALEKYLENNPNDIPAHRSLADVRLALDQYAEASAEYQRLEQAGVDHAILKNNHALAVLGLGNTEKAEALARAAYAAAPENPTFIDTLGLVLTRAGKADEAVGLLREANLRRNDDPGIRYHLALALAESNRFADARRELQNLLASDTRFPEREDAEALLARLP